MAERPVVAWRVVGTVPNAATHEPGYRTTIVDVGRVWFLWLPHGQERQDVQLSPE